MFRIMASSDQLYQTYAVSIAEKLSAKRIAFLGPNDELGKNDAKAIKAEVEKMKSKGVSFVGEEYYERGARDFGPALLRLIAQKPDIIDTDGSPTGSIALIAKQARELGYNGYFVNTTAVLEAKAIADIAGKAGDNIIALRIWANPPTKLYSELAERHQKKYGEAAPGTLWETYGAARWLVDTITKAGTFDTKKVADALGRLDLRRPSVRRRVVGRREDVRHQAADRHPDPRGDSEERQVGAVRREVRQVRVSARAAPAGDRRRPRAPSS